MHARAWHHKVSHVPPRAVRTRVPHAVPPRAMHTRVPRVAPPRVTRAQSAHTPQRVVHPKHVRAIKGCVPPRATCTTPKGHTPKVCACHKGSHAPKGSTRHRQGQHARHQRVARTQSARAPQRVAFPKCMHAIKDRAPPRAAHVPPKAAKVP